VPSEPPVKRTFAFFDGQNLFYAAKEAFGYSYPNYDPKSLTDSICATKGWTARGIYFYTGVPTATDKPDWNNFWTAKMAVMGTRGIKTFSRALRYRNQTVVLRDGTRTSTLVGQEKGVDVRIALDIVRFALEDKYDVALIFSQDQDLTEAVQDVKKIAVLQNRWINVACAFPVSPTVPKTRGINGTDWTRIDRSCYDSCIDPNDYRPKKGRL
jgi:uncharacterized LabA/DUF88 family protein